MFHLRPSPHANKWVWEMRIYFISLKFSIVDPLPSSNCRKKIKKKKEKRVWSNTLRMNSRSCNNVQTCYMEAVTVTITESDCPESGISYPRLRCTLSSVHFPPYSVHFGITRATCGSFLVDQIKVKGSSLNPSKKTILWGTNQLYHFCQYVIEIYFWLLVRSDLKSLSSK